VILIAVLFTQCLKPKPSLAEQAKTMVDLTFPVAERSRSSGCFNLPGG